jgi:tRNA A37 methylthiotransferase MiaB
MPHPVPALIARERNQILRELSTQKHQAFMDSFVGKTLQAITLNGQSSEENPERNSRESFTPAITDNYLKLRLKGHRAPNHWVVARITASRADELAVEFAG